MTEKSARSSSELNVFRYLTEKSSLSHFIKQNKYSDITQIIYTYRFVEKMCVITSETLNVV